VERLRLPSPLSRKQPRRQRPQPVKHLARPPESRNRDPRQRRADPSDGQRSLVCDRVQVAHPLRVGVGSTVVGLVAYAVLMAFLALLAVRMRV
jgi:hypothetical protein